MNIFQRIFKSFMRGPIYIILFGLIFFGIGGGLTYRQYAFEKQAIEVPGVVTANNMSCDDDGCTYKPVIDFATKDGQTITFSSSYSSDPPRYDVGEKVTVFYAPNDPRDAVIKNEGIVFRIIFMSVGGIIMLVGLGIFAANIRNSYMAEE